MIREELLALADELEAFEGDTCERCAAYEQPECRVYLPCTEIVAKYCARKMMEAVERDGEGATTVSAYDLLPEEDRKAIVWVREHGGLGSVKNRLMPEGMKWPRYGTGEFVDFGDEVARDGGDGAAAAVDKIVFHGSLWQLFDRYGCEINEDMMGPGERVKRPAPKVLDADGVEIRKGDVLYSVETGDCVTVGSIELGNPWFAATDGALEHCAKFTHKRPVLDADGVLCREGDEVWEVRSHRRREIVGTHYRDYKTGEPLILCDGDDEIPIPATYVTHTKPEIDTWERLEEDAGKNPFDYCKDVGHRLDTCENAERYKARDLVRRCRALAERGEL